MSIRRPVSSEVSTDVVEYVLRQGKFTQEQLADALEVSPAFISRVRSKERSFTVDHLVAIEKLVGIPLGALLLAAIPIAPPRPETERLHKLLRAAMLQADKATAAIRRSIEKDKAAARSQS
jgi:transcriptional regulator with XRE-family HTH domain